MSEFIYGLDTPALYAAVLGLLVMATILGAWMGGRSRQNDTAREDFGLLAASSLGLLALLLAFSFSLALDRYDARRTAVVEEANAIGSAANFTLMLPEAARRPIFALLHEYTQVRIGLGVPFDEVKFQSDVARSLELQSRLWERGVAVTAELPQSLPVFRFVGSLNDVSNVHESRITAMRNRIPGEVPAMLIGVAAVAMLLAGYHAGVRGARVPVATILMSAIVGVVMVMVADLDRPARGFIQVPVQSLIDAARSIPR